jgi:hypothetical protein
LGGHISGGALGVQSAAAMSFFKGYVKEVPSGDTIVVSGGSGPSSNPAPAPEKRIVLASLSAPRLVRVCGLPNTYVWKLFRHVNSREVSGFVVHAVTVSVVCQGRSDGVSQDEPFAWSAREFLRKKAIGKVITVPRISQTAYVACGLGHQTLAEIKSILQEPRPHRVKPYTNTDLILIIAKLVTGCLRRPYRHSSGPVEFSSRKVLKALKTTVTCHLHCRSASSKSTMQLKRRSWARSS